MSPGPVLQRIRRLDVAPDPSCRSRCTRSLEAKISTDRGTVADQGIVEFVRFSVVIPTFERQALLEETLESLYACEPPPDEILVVDGHPELQAKEIAARFTARPALPELRYLTGELSSTKQRNVGIDA